MVLGRQTITFGTRKARVRKARVPAAKVLGAPECAVPGPGPQVGPQAGPQWPTITKNGPPEGSVVQVDGQNQLGYCSGYLWGRVWTPVAPKQCPLGPKWVRLAPECVLWAETKKWPYLGLDGLPIRGDFFHVPKL